MNSLNPPGNEARCWIVVASRAAVDHAVAGGYIEISHGKATPLARMRPGDAVACYSPREHDAPGAPLQAFTALGRIADAPIYQLPHDHQPFRRAMDWVDATPALVRPLIDELGFIHNKAYWGTAFRYGYLRVPPEDFARIAQAMELDWVVATVRNGAAPLGQVDDAATRKAACA
jgi:hypothetical protein